MGDAAVQRAVFDHFVAFCVRFDLNHCHTLDVLERHHFVSCRWRAFALGRQVDFRVHIFGVHRKNGFTVYLEQLHTIGIFTEDLIGLCDWERAVRVESTFAFGPKRVTVAHEHFGFVAFRHMHFKVGRDVHRFECKLRAHRLRRCRRGEEARAHHRSARTERKRAAQETTAGNRAFYNGVKSVFFRARVAHFIKIVPGKVVDVLGVFRCVGHDCPLELAC